MIGAYQFPWSNLVAAWKNLQSHIDSLQTSLPNEHRLPLTTFSYSIGDIENARRVCKSTCGHKHHVLLTNLLERFRSRKATDPRDKVFGFLGLQNAFGRNLTHIGVDYTMQTNKVYTLVTIELLKAHRSLNILEGNKRQVVPNLPSWVPDWSCCTTWDPEMFWLGTDNWLDVLRLYRAHPCHPAGFEFSYSEGDGLQVDGVIFDSVTNVVDGSVSDYHATAPGGVGRQTIQFLDALDIHFRGCEAYVTGCSLDEAFYRTMTGDLNRATSEDGYKKWCRPADASVTRLFLQNAMSIIKLNTGTFVEETRNVHSLLLNATWQQRLFVTSKGYIGLGHINMRAGDKIGVLNGAAHPFVLRFKPSVDGCASAPKYFMIGTSYVHGIMDGEALGTEIPMDSITLV